MFIKMLSIALSEKNTRIFKKSYARYKKHGYDGMQLRLNKEYRNLYPNYQYKSKINGQKMYRKWIENNEKNIYKTLYYNPKISIVMPVYNTDIVFLSQAVQSVLDQKYLNWELCIVDDCSSNIKTIEYLKKIKSNKIKISFNCINKHISETTNIAISMATGDYIVLLDHDDMLSENALYEIVYALNQNNGLKLIYSDEDKIDEKNNRFSPHFKPDFCFDTFSSYNYICHLVCIKRSLIDEIGGFRIGYEGSQDYDLLLRAIKYISTKEIYHISKILYHWRSIKGSTAYGSGEKAYTHVNGKKALQDYFSNCKNIKVLDGKLPNLYKVEYPIDTNNKVSIIIPTRNKKEILKKCIDSIIGKTTYENYEIIIVNNYSDEPDAIEYFKYLQEEKNVKIIDFNKDFNYSAINNYAVKYSKGNYLVFMNNDIEIITENWIEEMLQHSQRDEIGAVGVKLYYPNNTIQHAGVILGIGGVAGHSHKYFSKHEYGYFSRLMIVQNYSAVTGACLMVKKSKFLEVNGFNECDLKVAFNDVDLCLKLLKRGYRNIFTPYVEMYHHESISRGVDKSGENLIRFNKEVDYMKNKYKDILLRDNSYNPNLTLEYENFTFR